MIIRKVKIDTNSRYLKKLLEISINALDQMPPRKKEIHNI